MMKTVLFRTAAMASLLSLSACGALDFFGEDEVLLSGTRIPVRT